MRRALVVATFMVVASCGGSDELPAASRRESPQSSQPAPEAASAAATGNVHDAGAAVALAVRPAPVPPGGGATAVLTNEGRVAVGFSEGYKLEKRTADGWRWVNEGQAFTRPLYTLEPGDRTDPRPIDLYTKGRPVGLEPGTYRLTIDLIVDPHAADPRRLAVAAVFRVATR